MKTLKFLLLALIVLLFINCATTNSKGLHSKNYTFSQPPVKTHSVNSFGLYVSRVKPLGLK